jgi:hypothetical protein
LKKYRRVEINAYCRRVTIVSGEWPRDSFDVPPAETTDEVSLNDTDSCEPVEPGSPEGQLILVEAVRSLERRLSPETCALICSGQYPLAPNRSNRNRFGLNLQSFYQFVTPRILNFFRKRDRAVKQSVKH